MNAPNLNRLGFDGKEKGQHAAGKLRTQFLSTSFDISSRYTLQIFGHCTLNNLIYFTYIQFFKLTTI